MFSECKGVGGLLALLLRRKQHIWFLKVRLAESKQEISSSKPCLNMGCSTMTKPCSRKDAPDHRHNSVCQHS